jgi:Rrf2 family protein
MVAKVLKLLVRAGLLESHRGVRGGYLLTRAPSDISIAEIINTLDGPLTLTECTSEHSGCAVETSCPVRAPWNRINDVIRDALERVTLAEMTCPIADPASTLVSELGHKRPRAFELTGPALEPVQTGKIST